MADPIPRGPFDEGLFLAHFNKGREHFEAAHLEEAERELEEAYLLRPRDVRVLNLLGLVYFRQEKLERAEEVYRKLVAESPEAQTLHYNLGLICLKLNRPEDALSALVKALELAPDNPKVHFYLGQIYERLHRYKDAIYQYRQAGANMLVRRVEGKLATSPTPAQARPPVKVGTDRPDTKPPGPAPRRPDGEDHIATAKVVVPVSPALLSDSPPRSNPSDTDRFAAFRDDTLPPQNRQTTGGVANVAPAGTASEDAVPAPPAPAHPTPATHRSDQGGTTPAAVPLATPSPPPPPATTPPHGSPGPGREVFRCVEKGLMEVDFSGKVFLKQGTIYSYTGNLTFWVKEKRAGGVPALVIVTGTGRLLLTDHERDITLMQVAEEPVFVQPAHLLACEEGLQPRYERIGGPDDEGVDVVVLEGAGRVALSVASKPLPLTVRAGFPVSVPSHSVIMWTGQIDAAIVDDPAVYEVVLATKPGDGPLLRLVGEGRVLVEQTTS